MSKTVKNGPAATWGTIGRIILKAVFLFTLCNLLFAAALPLEALGRISLYNRLFPGRLRLPYGENQAASNSLTLNNLPAMLHSHILAQPKPANEYRVIVLGDSAAWGWLLTNEETLTARLNVMGLTAGDGKQVKFYNLGYPLLSVTKDLLILDKVLAFEPDLVIWPVTLESLALEKQLEPPLVQHNFERLAPLIVEHELSFDLQDNRWEKPSFWQRTLVVQRRPLADLWRLQLSGLAWSGTGIDQPLPRPFDPVANDLKNDHSWYQFSEPAEITRTDIALEVLSVGIQEAGTVPVLIVNEPVFRADGQQSDVRFNSFYPRWVYEEYRRLLAAEAEREGWLFADLWDAIPNDEFTDTPVHLTPDGTELMAERLAGRLTTIIP